MVEGAVVGAMARGSVGPVHAGVVHPVPEMGAFSMSPLCCRYRKANGDRPVAYERCRLPQLTRRLQHGFGAYRGALVPLHGRKLCRWCVSVWDADAALEASAVVAPDDLSGLGAA